MPLRRLSDERGDYIMWDQAVVTNAGKQLFAEWTAGKTLVIDGAKAGAGTVAAAALLQQTAVTQEKQALSIISAKPAGDGTQFHVQIIAPDTAYTAKQIGIYAHIGTGTSQLIALYQDETGIAVPSKTEMPDYVYAFYATVQGTNAGSISVTLDANALVSRATLDTLLAAKASVTEYTATIGTTWSGSTAPYTQEVTVTGIGATDEPLIDIVQTGTEETDSAMREAWGMITRITTASGRITVYSEEKPTVSIPIRMKVVK